MVPFVLMFAVMSVMVGALSIALILALRYPWDSRFRFHIRTERRENSMKGSNHQRAHANAHMQMHTVVLSDEDRDGFVQVWHSVYSGFNSDPKRAVCYADLLMCDIVGDPVRGSDGTVELALDRETTEMYRTAHEIAKRNQRQDSNPDELELAMHLYAAVFEEVISDQSGGAEAAAHQMHSGFLY